MNGVMKCLFSCAILLLVDRVNVELMGQLSFLNYMGWELSTGQSVAGNYGKYGSFYLCINVRVADRTA